MSVDEDRDKLAFVALARRREDAAAELWSRYSGRMVAYARAVLSRTGDQSYAEDVVQKVFVSVMHLGKRRAEAVRSVEGWLIAATRSAALNVARGERREQKRRRALEARVPGPPSYHEHLRACIEALPPDQAEIIALRHGFGMTYDAIAELTGAPKSTLATRYARALDRLRAMLDEHGRTQTPAASSSMQEIRRA